MRFWLKQVISEKLKKRVKNHEDLIVGLMRKNDALMLENVQLMDTNMRLMTEIEVYNIYVLNNAKVGVK